MEHRFVTLLTDYGLEDDFAGTCHGVIKRIAPEVEVIHLTHGIAPQHVLQGALALARTLPYVPPGVHVAVVDPEVGSERRAVALRGADERLYVGPDNGLLIPAAERLGGIAQAVEIENREYMLEPVSATFHGRDVFAPAAAYLARGVALGELGSPVPLADLERLELPEARVSPNEVTATVIDVDRFGNIELNATAADLEQARIRGTAELESGRMRRPATVGRTFTDVAPDEALVYEDAYGRIAVAINRGNAAAELSAGLGTTVTLRA